MDISFDVGFFREPGHEQELNTLSSSKWVPAHQTVRSYELNQKREIGRDQELQIKFDRLVREWREERGFSSSQNEIYSCRAHMAILAMGNDAVPLIMEQIQKGVLDHWFSALELITSAQPVQHEDRGNYKKMAQAWLKWWENKS